MRRNSSKTSTIGIIITAVVLVIIIIISNIGTNQLQAVQTGANKIFMPVQSAFVYIKNKLTGNTEEQSNIDSLKKENSELREENKDLKEAKRELEILKSENNTLKEYLNLKNKYADYETTPAYVIERTYSNYDKILVINVGKNDNIEVNMPVISESGLVGHVISVTDKTAKVQTIIDTSSSTSCLISSSRDSIVCKGTLNDVSHLKAMYIPTNATLSQGDTVETSGIGGIYQKGILIGNISRVENSSDLSNRYAVVDLAVNFEKLETVLVITN